MIAQRMCDTRALGIQLWQNNIEGFLHWGYNFWNTQYSYDHVDPYLHTDGDYFVPSGDTMLVYPGSDGTAWESLRLNALREAMEDMRMLSLCEAERGRGKGEKTLEGEGPPFGGVSNAAKPLPADFALQNRRSPSKPPSSPRTSLHGNRRIGLWGFSAFFGRRLPYREVFRVVGRRDALLSAASRLIGEWGA